MSISDAYVRIECDFCEDPRQRLELQLTHMGFGEWCQVYTIDQARRQGWDVSHVHEADDHHKCPNCVEREKKDA